MAEQATAEADKNTPENTPAKEAAQNVFRREYRELTEVEKEALENIKDKAGELYALIETAKATREQSLAKTKLEESVMWIVKSITS